MAAMTTQTEKMARGFGRRTTKRFRSNAVSLFMVLLSLTACETDAVGSQPGAPVAPVPAADATAPLNYTEASIFAQDSSPATYPLEASVSTPEASLPPVDASTTPDTMVQQPPPDATIQQPPPDATIQQPESGANETDCLSCHGPYSAVQAEVGS